MIPPKKMSSQLTDFQYFTDNVHFFYKKSTKIFAQSKKAPYLCTRNRVIKRDCKVLKILCGTPIIARQTHAMRVAIIHQYLSAHQTHAMRVAVKAV